METMVRHEVSPESVSITRKLADFASRTVYEDLPEEVIDYTKLLIMDTVICGMAAGWMDRTRMLHGALESLGGRAESSVFGTRQRYPAVLAAMANSEIMNALDADDSFFTSSHFAALNVSAALAEGQRNRSSGQDLIRATALGFDVNARLNLASVVVRAAGHDQFEWASVQGMGFSTFGVAVTAGILKGFDREKMRNVFGLVNHMAPTPTVNTTSSRSQHPSFKMANYQGVGFSGMWSAVLADHGYVAEQGCLDDGGFLRAQGCVDFDKELLCDELGEKWWIEETSIKYYPSCRFTHGPIDMLQRLMDEQNISANEIERIVIFMNPLAYALKLFREPARSIAWDHLAPFNGQFNIPYVIALAALGFRPGPQWYSRETMSNPNVWALASRISTEPDESAKDEVYRSLSQRIRRARETPASMKVYAKGREFHQSIKYVQGDPWIEETRPTWDRLSIKFHDFCDGLMSADRIDRMIDQFKSLEKVNDVDAMLDFNS